MNDKIQFSKLCGYSVAEHKSSIVPLYRWDQNKIRDFVGTGTLIQFHGKHLLISCAHCFDRGGEHEVTVGSANEFSIDRPVLTTQLPHGVDRNRDPVDFAVVLLTTNEITNLATRSTFIPDGAIEGLVVEEWSDDFGIIGFPARDNVVDLVNRSFTAKAVELPARKVAKFSDQQSGQI